MMLDEILKEIGEIKVPGFFVTVDFVEVSSVVPPLGIENFILQKYQSIKKGTKGRKFSYQTNGWRMHFTFFPTDSVVEPKYAMMNKFVTAKKRPYILDET